MKTIGFVISQKVNERRRALIPLDLKAIRNVSHLYFEKGYGEILGYSDTDYRDTGASVVVREEVYEQDVICNLKTPAPEEQRRFSRGQTLFGWIHAVQGREITDLLLEKEMTAIAWEDMFVGGRHVFWRNNELAGEAAVMHAFLCYGRAPYECDVAVLGRGNCARGVVRVLEKMGARITVYDRKTIIHLSKEIGEYDVIVNAILWDVFQEEPLIRREDLGRMRDGSLIIDVSCNEGLEIETSHPTTLTEPTYAIEGILHYVVDHTATMLWKTASESISRAVSRFVDDLVEGNRNTILDQATILRAGKVIDERIAQIQSRPL